MNKKIEIFMAVVMLGVLCMLCFGMDNVKAKSGSDLKQGKFTVVLDAGHGGADPGKVGVNGCIESEINLEIVKKLASYLEGEGIDVVLTRTDENGLYDENASNKKKSDMNKRCEMIEEINPDLLISIHQNSYSSEGVKGAQVFYYKGSKEGGKLATLLQDRLIKDVDPENGRECKDNNNYYIIKNVECPAVIVECGFLSNYSEAELLASADYQEKIARAIGSGVIDYLENR